MFVAIGIDPKKEIKVNFLMFLRLLKMLDESEARRQQGAMLGFNRDQTDKLYSALQGLDPENRSGTVKREIVEKALTGSTTKYLTKLQLVEVIRILSQEPAQIEFGGFLRTMKLLEGFAEGTFNMIIDEVLKWQEKPAGEEEDPDGVPQYGSQSGDAELGFMDPNRRASLTDSLMKLL